MAMLLKNRFIKAQKPNFSVKNKTFTSLHATQYRIYLE